MSSQDHRTHRRVSQVAGGLRHRAGFTLVELLVIIGIITLLLGIALPAIAKVREASNRFRCASNLRQLGLGAHAYYTTHKHLPPGQSGPYKKVPGQPYYGWGRTSTSWSWLARLLPFLDEDNLYHFGGIPIKSLEASGACDRRILAFLCPSDEAYHAPARLDAGNLPGFPVGHTNYKGVSGSNWGEDKGEGVALRTLWRNRGTNGSYDGLIEGDGLMWRADVHRRMRLEDVSDGASNTFMIGEDVPRKNRWCSWPYANNAYGTCAIPPNVDGFPESDWHNLWSFRSSHPAGLHFCFADGHVQFVRSTIELEVYRALATIRGGEAVDARLGG